MSSIITKNFGVTNAKNFETFVSGSFANTYVMIGRQIPWSAGDTIPTAIDTANTYYDVWYNAIGLKKITAADMNLVVPRVDWAANETYFEYTQDAQLFVKASSTNIQYDNKFYVRNNRDQVFKCLFNNGNTSSTIMPEISIDGQLPENAFIETSDGYKWKYLYTIPAGLKERFFTSDYMPIVEEDIVTNNAVDGRLDIIKILNGGAGFNSNSNSNSYNILTFTGDGSNANITAVIRTNASANGANIVDYNIINGGNNYTRATISVVDLQKIQATANANLVAVIGPPGGHGSNIEQELGASNLMLCVEIEGDEAETLPIVNSDSQFRQISIIKDPKFAANNGFITGSTYRLTTKFDLTEPSSDFLVGETVYAGDSLATAEFIGVVEAYDNAGATKYLYLNNLVGTISAPKPLVGVTSGTVATVLLIHNPLVKKFSGDLLYIENSAQISRDLTETQQIKLTLRF